MIAEKAVLGSILKEPYLIKETNLQPEHLTSAINQRILKRMRDLESEGKPIDFISVLTRGNADEVGGGNELVEMQRIADIEKFEGHVDLVMDAWREREKQNILHIAKDWEINKITKELDNLTSDKTTDHTQLKDLLTEVYELPWTKQEKQTGIPTGIRPVDIITGGWQNTDLIIVAARPSMGKTDLMLKFAKEAGFNGYLPIVFSLEMPAYKLNHRLMASTAMVDRGKFKDLHRFMTEAEKQRWQPAANKLAAANIQIFDKAGQTVSEMRMKVRKVMNQFPGTKPIILADYLQLFRSSDFFNGNRNLQIADISKSLKEVAKEFNCPVICLSQLSREVEKRPDKRPMMSDLRDSGSIEQDADIILFPYRHGYYTKDDSDNEMELIFSKHRNGETGVVKAYYDKPTGDVTI